MKKFFLLLVLCSPFVLAQEYSKTFQGNSFYIEEAYNQEEGIVQHIFTGTGSTGTIFSTAQFTEEWPAFGQTHQLSITIPYLYSSSLDGVGDFLFNYRYQLVNVDGLAVSPRFSVIIPTGNDGKGLGDGVVGIQLNLPVSRRWSDEFITHFNSGLTILPNVDIGATTETQTEYFIGASGIYLANKNFNLLTEIVYTAGNGTEELILNPGVRFAVDIGTMQIVPGLAFPIVYTSGRQESGIFLYLSFEHPF
ncbi:MAG: transporter [Ignavibacteriales bacterium]|nr:transporter [Ignavibacteriales bacterium]